jgi:AAA domain
VPFVKAVRKEVPMLISVASVSGGGKTLSALLLAAGIAGPDGVVGFIDTENGRGSMYADSPRIVKALPKGYILSQIDPPFPPSKYIGSIEEAEKAGVTVVVIDSGTHEWEGEGGCCDIADNNKLGGMPNWAKAKREHKKFLNTLMTTSMHVILCLRARDKVKIQKVNGRDEIIPMGLQPITEKNLPFEMLLSLQLDEKTHFANPIKIPESLAHLFDGTKLITKEDGEKIRLWNQSGAAGDPYEPIRKRSRGAAEMGTKEYAAFYATLTPVQKKHLADTVHADNKKIAIEADAEAWRLSQQESGDPAAANARIGANAPEFNDFPDAFEYQIGNLIRVKGVLYACNLDRTGWVEYKQ